MFSKFHLSAPPIFKVRLILLTYYNIYHPCITVLLHVYSGRRPQPGSTSSVLDEGTFLVVWPHDYPPPVGMWRSPITHYLRLARQTPIGPPPPLTMTAPLTDARDVRLCP